MPRSPRIDVAAAKAMPGVIGVLTGRELKADGIGNLICGWMIHSKDGSPMKMGAWSPLAVDRVRYVGDAVVVVVAETKRPGARRRRGGRGHLQRAARRHRRDRGAGGRRAAAPSGGRRQSDLRLGARRRQGDRCGARQGRARHPADHRQQPARSQRHGAARRAWRLRQGRGPLHLLDDVAEPASRAAGDERLLQCRAGEQAAGHRAGCRRRLRLEDLHLSGRGRLPLGLQEAPACR